MGIVQDDHKRSLGRHFRQQVENRHRDTELLRNSVAGPSKCRVKRGAEG
jgi:hypothetical protein